MSEVTVTYGEVKLLEWIMIAGIIFYIITTIFDRARRKEHKNG